VELNGTGGTAYYNYDGGGQRVQKVVVKSGRRTERLYLGGVERYREYSASSVNNPNGTVEQERWTVQIDDIAQVDTLTVDNSAAVGSPVPLIRYQYRDHLGSATMETNENGQVISYEEYHPFGTSAYRTAKSGTDLSLKRYRFTNKERDDETGLYYFGVRYYAAWLGRWTSSDPGDFVDGLNMYVYVRNNPVNGVDELGYETEPPPEGKTHKIQLEDGTTIDSSVSEENIATVKPSWDASTAAWGLLRLIGGTAQAIAGMAGIASANPAGIIVGGIAVAKGYDDMVTGFQQMWTGAEQESFTERATEEVYRGLGYNEQEAEAAGNTMDILLSAVSPSGVISTGAKAPQLARAGSGTVTLGKAAQLEKIAKGGQAGSIAAQAADEVGDHIVYAKNNKNSGNNNTPDNPNKPSNLNSNPTKYKATLYIGELTFKSDLLKPLLKGKQEWIETVKAIKKRINPDAAASSGQRYQVRVETKSDADAFLNEILGNMDKRKNHTQSRAAKGEKYNKGYEVHQQGIEGKSNTLYHIKWYLGNATGHIFYQNPH
jgi:RHS repeat-associated protein